MGTIVVERKFDAAVGDLLSRGINMNNSIISVLLEAFRMFVIVDQEVLVLRIHWISLEQSYLFQIGKTQKVMMGNCLLFL